MYTRSVGWHRSVGKYSASFLALTICLLTLPAVKAEIVELSITASWSDRDFKVIKNSDQSYSPVNPRFDGKVFGVEPSAGEVTVVLLVNTDESVFFPKGSQIPEPGGNSSTLTHDFYGYREVSLANGAFSFGSATWRTDGILTALEGPERMPAALWTDVDITKEDPIGIRFRMFGSAVGLKADLYVKSRTDIANARQFLLWEYYAGEEIRSRKFVVRRKVLTSSL